MESLPFYSRKIVPSYSPMDDYCYIMTPYSVCMVKIDNNRVTELQTCTLARAMQDNFAEDKKKMLSIPPSETERSSLDYTAQELKLDGQCRVVTLPQHRLLVCQGARMVLVTIRFD